MYRLSILDGITNSRRGSWCLLDAKPGTWLILGLIACWSAASHLACAAPREGLSSDENDDSISGRPSIVEVELGEMLPFEPFWDLLLPFLGLCVSAFGMQLTLALSFMQPLVLLALPLTKGILRGFHDRLLSWHLGGIFGQPMLVAQLAVVRGECYCPGVGAAALGGLVGAYALGALVGAALRRTVSLAEPFLGLRSAMVVWLVGINITMLHLRADLLRQSIFRPSPRLSGVPVESFQEVASAGIFRKIIDAVNFSAGKISRVLRIGILASDTILARALILLSFTAVVSPTPARRIDLFAGTPLRHGFGVLWFDVAQVLTSSFIVPLTLGAPFSFSAECCLRVCFKFALFCCLVASFAAFHQGNDSFHFVMLAGLSLGICAAFAGAVLSLRTIRRAAREAAGMADAAVALGWGLLASGVSQVAGAEVGEYLYHHYSWLGVTMAAGLICATSWYIAMLFPDDDDIIEKHSERLSLRTTILRS